MSSGGGCSGGCSLRRKYQAELLYLDERGTLGWVVAETMAIGWGESAAVAAALGFSGRTIRNAIAELKSSTHSRPFSIRVSAIWWICYGIRHA